MAVYKDLVLGQERALYALAGDTVENCTFAGEEDGESALKECRNIAVRGCDFRLRYPLWHLHGGSVENSAFADTARAAMWYCDDMTLENSRLGGIKALRECDRSTVRGCEIESAEFGWLCRGIRLENSSLVSEYPFFGSRDLEFDGLTMKGKYSFQYVQNAVLRGCVLDTKDAFWHAKNITVYDSVIKGEYLAWYSENLRLVRCRSEGTQPLCYCKGLVLEECEMVGCDLSFENSHVTATVKGNILSVKNPLSGSIVADSIGEIIFDENLPADADCTVTVRQ